MMDKLFSDTIANLTYRSKRQELIALNLANSDTPGYKSKDLISAFQSALALNITNNQHIHTSKSEQSQIVFNKNDGGNIDGNTVDVDKEMLKFTDNTLHTQVLLNNIKHQVQMMKLAIKG